MPGLEQLKKFNSDILSVGKESSLRSARGERPVTVAIPPGVKDEDDSDDFIAGLPERETEEPAARAPVQSVEDEDFSDITGVPAQNSAGQNAAPAEASENVPDLSSLLSPMASSDAADGGEMPDLSMFEDQPEPAAEEEPEAQEPSVADLGLDELLGSAGFDGEIFSEDAPSAEAAGPAGGEDSAGGTEAARPADSVQNAAESAAESAEPAAQPAAESAESAARPDDSGAVFAESAAEEAPSDSAAAEFSLDDLPDFDAVGGAGAAAGTDGVSADSSGASAADGAEEQPDGGDFDIAADGGDSSAGDAASSDGFASENPPENLFDAADLDLPDDMTAASGEGAPSPDSAAAGGAADFELPDISLDDLGADFPSADGGSFSDTDFPSAGGEDFSGTDFTAGDEAAAQSAAESAESAARPDDSGAAEFSLDDLPDFDAIGGAEAAAGTDGVSADSSGASAADGAAAQPDGGDFDIAADGGDSSAGDAAASDDFASENPPENLFDAADLDLPDDMTAPSGEGAPSPDSASAGGAADFELPDISLDDLGADFPSADGGSFSDTDFPSAGGEDFSGTDFAAGDESAAESAESAAQPDDSGAAFAESAAEEAPSDSAAAEFSLDDLPDFDAVGGAGAAAGTDGVSADSSGASAADGAAAQPDGGDFDIAADGGDSSAGDAAASDGFASENPPENLFDAADLDLPDDMTAASGEGAPSPGSDSAAGGGEQTADAADDPFSGMDFNLDDLPEGESGEAAAKFEESAQHDEVDVSQMEGLDFSIADTDSQIAAGKAAADSDVAAEFDLDTDFEIPGFSDVDTASDVRKAAPAPSGGGADGERGDNLPKNTLSDDQYKKFLKNLSFYPVNVRIAAEELIVKNEFTDDAEFEIVEKILKKIPARQLAAELEKMLDISIPVPRDYEHRTAEEYEAYKSSLQYQLRNRIIPGAILLVLAASLGVGIFLFTRDFVYKPARASGLYREGYRLLTADEYPQSEMKFNEAVKYDLQKKWFYRYAQGYRERKQYERAGQMYRNILYTFKFDKPAGLQYAEMELYDLANYEKAENIVLRLVLDHHINDPDGLLLLGDTYLEWATEKDPDKFEDARVRYSELIQLYGPANLYLSRMMRYFVRTDNLLEVLQLKERFMPKKSSLGAQDWTEMSGYLFDKLYGPLPPSEEYLRNRIDDVKDMLVRAVTADPSNPTALYNLSRYYIQMNNTDSAISSLERTIQAYENAPVMKSRDFYREIDSHRLLGERYTDSREYLKARELYTDGITIFRREQETGGLEGTAQVGALFSDIGDIDYFVSGDMDGALENYREAVSCGNDTPQIRYRIGYIQYGRKNYAEALGSFMKAGEDQPDDLSLLLAMGNTLAIRDDNFAAQGYYEGLIDQVDAEREQRGMLLPQETAADREMAELYLEATNNLGVVSHRLTQRTGDSAMNARAMVNFQNSMRAWDALTRNPDTLVRLGGSNLAEQNMKYTSQPFSSFEPALYTELPRTLYGDEGLPR